MSAVAHMPPVSRYTCREGPGQQSPYWTIERRLFLGQHHNSWKQPSGEDRKKRQVPGSPPHFQGPLPGIWPSQDNPGEGKPLESRWGTRPASRASGAVCFVVLIHQLLIRHREL